MSDDPIFPLLAEWHRLEEAHKAAIRRTDETGTEAAELVQEAACDAAVAFESRLLQTRPTTPAGALALLRFIAAQLNAFSDRAEVADTIHNCVSIFEEASLWASG